MKNVISELSYYQITTCTALKNAFWLAAPFLLFPFSDNECLSVLQHIKYSALFVST